VIPATWIEHPPEASVTQIEDLESPEELQAAARSRLYQLLAAAFAIPDRDFHRAAQSGLFAEEVRRNAASLPYPVTEGFATNEDLQQGNSSQEELQSEYVGLFDVGMPRPPCPLFAGEYQKARRQVMEELVRFYNHFGVRLSDRTREMPDHIATELEFMHFLTFREVTALHFRQPRESYLRAQRDFLQRHLCAWLPLLRERLERLQPPTGRPTWAFYAALVRFTEAFTSCDRAYLETLTPTLAQP
jgi:DMSO reductase family type II enzyme chaperone